jgi:beta-lactamase superfamily II metal-dependent hydrolase
MMLGYWDIPTSILGRISLRLLVRPMLVIAALALTLLAPAAALAESVVVQRNVTVRTGPSRSFPHIIYPEIGAVLELLDEGARRSGYYHVRLADGRTGWVYYTFVRRQPDMPTVAAVPFPVDEMAVHYIDVDQGAAALLEFSCGAIMIDAGGRGTNAGDHLVAYLSAFFDRRADLNRTLDAVYVTHTHIDHNSNLRRIAQTFGIKNYIHNGLVTGSGSGMAKWMLKHAALASPPIPVSPISNRDLEPAGNTGLSSAAIDPVACSGHDPDIRVLSGSWADNPGWNQTEFKNGNNHSVAIRVSLGDAAFLFTGDLEVEGIEQLLHRFAGTAMLDVDVYEVGHHGSPNGTTPELLDAMTPDIAVISAGDPAIQESWTAWAYGHPRRALVEFVAFHVGNARPPASVLVGDRVKNFSPLTLSKAVYATAWDGDIVIRGKADGAIGVVTRP